MNFTDIMQWVAILTIATGNFCLSLTVTHHTKEISFIYEIFDAVRLAITEGQEHQCDECKRKGTCPDYAAGGSKRCNHFMEE